MPIRMKSGTSLKSGMAIFKLSRQVIENTLRTERHKVIVDLRDIAQQIATLKSRLIALDRERSEMT